MGGKFCFFTEPAKLAAQASDGAFGPLPPLAGDDRFRVTHWHDASAPGAPAVAICDGILCAQEDGSGSLTLILKPSQTPPFEAPVVSYFIYKGVDKASMLNGNSVLDENAAGANDLTKQVAATWKALNAGALVGSQAGLGLDRDSAFLHDANDPASKVFTDADPIERLFTYPHPTIQLPVVAAGDVIGSFGAKCGLEIVLLRLGYRPKLKFARTADNVIAVPSLSGGPRPADDADWFAHWHAKEQALAYLDPAAWFGAFVQAKLYKKSGKSTSRVKGSDVYDELLVSLANRNVAWLDVRNNYSYSYNLFGLHEGPLRFVSRSDSSQTTDLDFRSGGWPLLRLQVADVPGGRRGHLHRTALRLPAGLSNSPALLVSKGFVKRLGPDRQSLRTPKIAIDSDEPGFLTPVRIAFPAAKVGGQEVLTASYTRLNLYEEPPALTSLPAALNFAGSDYLDGVFRLRDLRLDDDHAGHSLRFDIYDDEILVDLQRLNGPTYAAAVGVAEDSNFVTLFAYPSHFLFNRDRHDQPAPQPSWAAAATNNDTNLLSKFAGTFRSITIGKRTIQPDSLPNEVDVITTRNGAADNHNGIADRNSLEHFCLIVLDRQTYNSLLAQALADTSLDATLPVFLTVSSSQMKRDAVKGVNYVDKTLRVSGFGTSGVKAVPVHTTVTQEVYSDADF